MRRNRGPIAQSTRRAGWLLGLLAWTAQWPLQAQTRDADAVQVQPAAAEVTQQRAPVSVAPSTDAAREDAYLKTGEAAYAAGRFEHALRAFDAAYAANPAPRTLYRIGDAADKLGWHARAIEALEGYLALVPDGKDRAFVESRVRENRLRLEAQRAALAEPAGVEANAPATAPAQAPAPALHAASAKSPSQPWWLWVGAGALVVGGITVAAVLLGAPAASTPAPIRGNVGPVVRTLNGP